MNPFKRPAVVAGLSETGLAVARSLSRRNVEVIGVHSGNEKVPAQWSRVLKFVRAPSMNNDSVLLDFYKQLATNYDVKPVLCPTGDPNVLFIYRHRKVLSSLYEFFIWESERLEDITSKRNLYVLCKQLELRVPPTIFADSWDGVKERIREVGFPCIVKPEYTISWHGQEASGSMVYGKKAISIANFENLEALYRNLKRIDSRVVIQKEIVGPVENHVEYPALVTKDGDILAEFSSKKLRVTPANYGMGSYVESTKDREVFEEGRKVIEKLDYYGLAMVQFKRDDRDGLLYFLELNPRFTVWIGLPVACGVDFPWLYYQLCCGRKIKGPSDYREGVRWLNSYRDFFELHVYLNEKSLSIFKWILEAVSPDVSAYFDFKDPGPGLLAGFMACRRIFKTGWRRLRRALRY
jgi:predicted ATP-grasp superfamily ATP-dependent carboligase